jgi:5-methylcytosine-specific restriction protein A
LSGEDLPIEEEAMTLRPCLVCSRPTAGSRCPENQQSGWQRGTRQMPIGWSSLRARVMAEEPICRVCGIGPSTQVDHVLNRARGGTDERSNLVGVCERCHRRKTAMEASV